MQQKFKRVTRAAPVTIGTSTTSATAIRLDDAAGFALLVGPMTASATVNVYVATDDSGGGLLVDGGSVVTLALTASTTAGAYALPDALFGARVMRLVGSSPLTGTVVMKT
jgi:hypothetical protein